MARLVRRAMVVAVAAVALVGIVSAFAAAATGPPITFDEALQMANNDET
jgi:hypothetical protein